MMNRQQVGTMLQQIGLRPVDQDVWMGFQPISGRVFPVFVHLRPNYVQVQVFLNLFTQCDQCHLYAYFSEINSRIAIGKFGVGPQQDSQGRPLVLFAEIPAGSDDAYTRLESIVLLFKFAFETIERHFAEVEARFRQGCGKPAKAPERPGRGVLDRIRIFDEKGA